MSTPNILAIIGLLVVTSYVASATDPTQLQDFCVGVNNPDNACNTSSIFYNFVFCGIIIVVHKAFLK